MGRLNLVLVVIWLLASVGVVQLGRQKEAPTTVASSVSTPSSQAATR